MATMSTFVSPDATDSIGATDAPGAADVPRARGGAPLVARGEFPLLAGDPALHYLDSAATAQKPRVVLDALVGYYTQANANPHRGAYRLSVAATDAYHDARRRVARFLGVADVDTLLFVRGTTEAMNLVAGSWGRAHVGAGDEVVVTAMDHHATFVTWQQLALAQGATFRICELTPDGRIDLEHLARLVGPRTRVVAFPHVSNALGTVNPVREIAALVRERSPAIVVVDGAQGAPHLAVDFDRLAAAGVDFYAFSGHKVGGPMGIGALVGRRALLEAMPPWQYGGDMISLVEDQRSTWNALPHRFEAGRPTWPMRWGSRRPATSWARSTWTRCWPTSRGWSPGRWTRSRASTACACTAPRPASAAGWSASRWTACTRTTWRPSSTSVGCASGPGTTARSR
jgi:cysteine desulfurase/selenocysteine lyase